MRLRPHRPATTPVKTDPATSLERDRRSKDKRYQWWHDLAISTTFSVRDMTEPRSLRWTPWRGRCKASRLADIEAPQWRRRSCILLATTKIQSEEEDSDALDSSRKETNETSFKEKEGPLSVPARSAGHRRGNGGDERNSTAAEVLRRTRSERKKQHCCIVVRELKYYEDICSIRLIELIIIKRAISKKKFIHNLFH